MKKFIFATLVALMTLGLNANAQKPKNSERMSIKEISTGVKKVKAFQTVILSANIHCKNCATKVRENISFEKGVQGLDISVENKTVTITFDPAKTNVEKLCAAMKKIGYPATVVE